MFTWVIGMCEENGPICGDTVLSNLESQNGYKILLASSAPILLFTALFPMPDDLIMTDLV